MDTKAPHDAPSQAGPDDFPSHRAGRCFAFGRLGLGFSSDDDSLCGPGSLPGEMMRPLRTGG